MNDDSIRMYLAYCSTLDDGIQHLQNHANMLITRKRNVGHLPAPEIISTPKQSARADLSRLAFCKDYEVDEMLIKALILRKFAISIAKFFWDVIYLLIYACLFYCSYDVPKSADSCYYKQPHTQHSVQRGIDFI